ncbi:LPXTG cell wall anchor domain-containing protein [Lactococcus insecticola]|uniref:Uncharacterized protein n=1 Tax=Pseudolactococcus insecticola TaxID=2709158 RepID=A0A6A0B921_9LACT|nr:LPXTG cell wall anchor domain-containing protein [Lactococcus insecticola]GFH40814.1 hypothetical protein Hs20B_12120 [Lactococcus insecticola]
MNKLNKVMSLATVSFALATPLTSVFTAFADDAKQETAATDNGQSKGDGVWQNVVKVNGNALKKDDVILPGDTVTFDIVFSPGNKGLLTSLTDTLPVGLRFDPNNYNSSEFFKANNDGTQGKEVTDQFDISINQSKITAIPKNPLDWFYVGSTTNARGIWRVTTVAEQTIKADTILTNSVSQIVTNPKDPDHPITTEDTAKVHTLKAPVGLTAEKFVSKDNLDFSDKNKKWEKFTTLDDKSKSYDYKVVYKVDRTAKFANFTMKDAVEGLQAIKAVDVYDTKGDKTDKVTDKFDVKSDLTPAMQTDGNDDQATVSATAKTVPLTIQKDESYTLFLDDVTFNAASDEELDNYLKGAFYVIPNTAGADYQEQGRDKKEIKSDTVKVKARKPAETLLDKVVQGIVPPTAPSFLPQTGEQALRFGGVIGALIIAGVAFIKRKAIKNVIEKRKA